MNTISDLLSYDVEAYLKQHENKDLLRFITCGSVDDGKSTLIGRLLYDNQLIFEDQLSAIQKDSKKYNTTDQEFDLALLVDGLQSEREQGITIDVAYRYFTTDQRKFIIADTPGHEQYTRNMATGASTSDLAIILIDARHGVQTQTRRHSFICSLLGIKHAIIAVNKMDTVDYSQQRYQDIKKEYREFASDLNFDSIQFVPVSALHGDNVVYPSKNMTWYPGSTLMRLLNSAQTQKSKTDAEFRFPVQYVNRPNLDFRGFCGTVVSGEIRVGDRIQVLPSGKESKVKSIVTFDGDLTSSYAGQAVTLTLEDEVDISRGDVLVRPDQQPHHSNSLDANIVWMNEDSLQINREYLIKVGTKTVTGQVSKIAHRVDVNTMQKLDASQLHLNEIGQCHLTLNEKVIFDSYEDNRVTGAFIIIDRLTNATVGAGMIQGALENQQLEHSYSEFEVELNQLVRKHFPHWDAKDLLSKG
ncbi:sulfate adenylyltransferase subunit CysN [Vibrio sp. UCD-FRSSP16_10]|uniref:sulfate adenylyltransferase subunit CysN n=1 Tax=unclassified Vibrio TaxID=2614977 RepID=UPI00080225C8|nr:MULTISPECIES: sulfate adenylyltransferase subunit CysN [unclassified Vibrio]OBT15516.1 sulfate adenylyltransferase subunit CysN [Vibrio sp. UCD-FRSSP16_30]OBT20589.1 sulfate adenylyltransferase subunit CysN [Vibrio sp. UCD-FRSSP16_10]